IAETCIRNRQNLRSARLVDSLISEIKWARRALEARYSPCSIQNDDTRAARGVVSNREIGGTRPNRRWSECDVEVLRPAAWNIERRGYGRHREFRGVSACDRYSRNRQRTECRIRDRDGLRRRSNVDSLRSKIHRARSKRRINTSSRNIQRER